MRILIVDDIETFCETLTDLLNSEGHDVLYALSADQAFRMLRGGEFDLLVLDVHIPRSLEGIELQKRLREARISIPVIMLSNETDTHTQAACLEAGALEYIYKSDPHMMIRLKEAISQSGGQGKERLRREGLPSPVEPREAEMLTASGSRGKLLLVDDHDGLRETIAEHLRNAGFEVDEAACVAGAIDRASKGAFDAVLLDIQMPLEPDGPKDEDAGIVALRELRESIGYKGVAITFTSHDTESRQIREIGVLGGDHVNRGEKDFLDQLLKKLDVYLSPVPTDYVKPEGIIGAGPEMEEVFRAISTYAPTKMTILITGETGTGKELVAQEIHRQSGRKGRLESLSCDEIQKDLIESEMFGHEKGAFTGAASTHTGACERADGGTLFLDEIGEATAAFQVKMLRFLEDGLVRRVGGEERLSIDVRVVAATNKDPEELVKQGRFREDLLQRLKQVWIKLPPLRDRKDDIPPLIEFFCKKASDKHGKSVVGAEEPVIQVLQDNRWEGNVRELGDLIERIIAAKHGDDTIALPDIHRHALELLAPETKRHFLASPSSDLIAASHIFDEPGFSIDDWLNNWHRAFIKAALRCKKASPEAAGLLDVDVGRFREWQRKIKKGERLHKRRKSSRG